MAHPLVRLINHTPAPLVSAEETVHYDPACAPVLATLPASLPASALATVLAPCGYPKKVGQ
jgi:hypothetical protein